jgi:phage anti-repressor protein
MLMITYDDLTMKLGYTDVQADWYLKMMVQIVIDEDGTVDARKLHELLGSKRQFADWIKQRIEKYGFVEDVDYVKLASQNCETKKHGGQNAIEYKLTVNMAKELSMIENNEQGREFRKYFIMAEEIANNFSQWNVTRNDAKGKKITMDKAWIEQTGVTNTSRLQEAVYCVVFGLKSYEIKKILDIPHEQPVLDYIEEKYNSAICFVYEKFTTGIEFGITDLNMLVDKVSIQFDKEFGGVIEL